MVKISGRLRQHTTLTTRGFLWATLWGCLLWLGSCTFNNGIQTELPPEILPETETGTYTVKVGRDLTLSPSLLHAEGAECLWRLDGCIVGESPSLVWRFEQTGQFYPQLTVTTSRGTARKEFRVDVLALTPPLLSLPVPAGGWQVEAGKECRLAPDILFSDLEEFRLEWSVNGQVASTDSVFIFSAQQTGRYTIELKAWNADGCTRLDVDVNVLEHLPGRLSFPSVSNRYATTDRYTVPGRKVYLCPDLQNIVPVEYAWWVASIDQPAALGSRESAIGSDAPVCRQAAFGFVPQEEGDYRVCVSVLAADGATYEASVMVHCLPEPSPRPFGGNGLSVQNNVYEFRPAPGQFVNAVEGAGYTPDMTTPEAAADYAFRRLSERSFVSLGGFGGYLVVGFDHSVVAGRGAWDLAVLGNAMSTSNEPGVVYVMQDTNGNGLPDDEWYELRGSETPVSIDYRVTYYRPGGPGMDVRWTDCEGREGRIAYLPDYHPQDTYYPLWEAESYTLRGVRLPANNNFDPLTGQWSTSPLGRGYADNLGEDSFTPADGKGQGSRFRLSDAVCPDGTPVNLPFVDFVKIQTGMNLQCGALGEVSTEVIGVLDYAMEYAD